MNTRICIIIPAYNEEKSIKAILKDMSDYKTIVIDDGSQDKTYDISKENCTFLLKNESNIGYDKTIQRGIRKAKELGFEYGITFDSDGQHKKKDVETIKSLLLKGEELVIGNRRFTPRLGEKLSSILFRLFTRIKDPYTGLKGYRLDSVNTRFLEYNSYGTSIMVQMIRDGRKAKQIWITTEERRSTKSRVGHGIKLNLICRV